MTTPISATHVSQLPCPENVYFVHFASVVGRLKTNNELQSYVNIRNPSLLFCNRPLTLKMKHLKI